MIQDILQRIFFGNTVQDYIIAVVIFLGTALAIKIFRHILLRYLKKWAAKSEIQYSAFSIVYNPFFNDYSAPR